MDDLVPTALVARILDRHLRLPATWDDAERREFVDEAAQDVALRVAELGDDWADRAVTQWGRQHWRLPDSEVQAELMCEARRSALVAVLCDVLPDVSVAELFEGGGLTDMSKDQTELV
ncbi:MAG TPA: hypothetical protein VMB04_15320 [Mycobacterium sp.]|nr:hypothetical protein [Mycobacterium sp.]